MHETTIEHIMHNDKCSISTGEKSIIRKIKAFVELKPEDAKIVSDNTDGSIYAEIPWSWIKIRPPRKLNLSDDERIRRSKLLRRDNSL